MMSKAMQDSRMGNIKVWIPICRRLRFSVPVRIHSFRIHLKTECSVTVKEKSFKITFWPLSNRRLDFSFASFIVHSKFT